MRKTSAEMSANDGASNASEMDLQECGFRSAQTNMVAGAISCGISMKSTVKLTIGTGLGPVPALNTQSWSTRVRREKKEQLDRNQNTKVTD